MAGILETILNSCFESPSTEVVNTISEFVETAVNDGNASSVEQPSQTSDSDSGESLFLTQNVSPMLRTIERLHTSERAELEADDEDEGDYNKEDQASTVERPDTLSRKDTDNELSNDAIFDGNRELLAKLVKGGRSSKPRKRRPAPPRPKRIEFPFMQESNLGQPTIHKNQALVNSEIGGFFKCMRKINTVAEVPRRELEPYYYPMLEDDYSETCSTEEHDDDDDDDDDDDVKVVDAGCFISKAYRLRKQHWLPSTHLAKYNIIDQNLRLRINRVRTTRKVIKRQRQVRQRPQPDKPCDEKIYKSCEFLDTTEDSDDETVINETQRPLSNQALREAEEISAPQVLEDVPREEVKAEICLEQNASRELQERDSNISERVHHLQENNELHLEIGIGSQDLFEQPENQMGASVVSSPLEEISIREGNEEDQESCVVQCGESVSDASIISHSTHTDRRLNDNLSPVDVASGQEISEKSGLVDEHKKGEENVDPAQLEKETPVPEMERGETGMCLEKISLMELQDSASEHGYHELQESDVLDTDVMMASSPLKEVRVTDRNEEEQESCVVQSDQRNSLWKEMLSNKNHSEVLLDVESGSHADNTEYGKLQTLCYEHQLGENTSPVAEQIRQPANTNDKKTLADDGMSCPESNVQFSHPAMSPTVLSGPEANVDLSQSNDLVMGGQAETANSPLFNDGELRDLKRRKRKNTQASEMVHNSHADTGQNYGTLGLVEKNSSKDGAFEVIQNSMQFSDLIPEETVKKKKRKRKLVDEQTANVTGNQTEGIIQVEALDVIQHSEEQRVTKPCLEEKENKRKRKREQVAIEHFVVRHSQAATTEESETLELLQDSHQQYSESAPEKEVQKKKKKKKQKKSEHVIEDHLAVEGSQTLAMQQTMPPEVGQYSHQQHSESSTEKEVKKKKKRDTVVAENTLVMDNPVATTGQSETLELHQDSQEQSIEMLPERKLKKKKKKKKKEHVDETSQIATIDEDETLEVVQDSHQCESVPVTKLAMMMLTTEQVEASGMVLGSNGQAAELVSEKKLKKKKKREKVVEEDVDIEQAESQEMVQDFEQQGSNCLPEKKGKKKKKSKHFDHIAEVAHQVTTTEQEETLELLQDSQKNVKKKKKKRSSVDHVGVEEDITDQVETQIVLHYSQQHDSELVQEEKLKKKKKKTKSEHIKVIQETGEQQPSKLVLEEKIKKKKKKKDVREHLEAIQVNQETAEQQYTELVPEKKLKKKKIREHLVEMDVNMEQADSLEVYCVSKPLCDEPSLEKKIKKKRRKDSSISHETAMAHEVEARKIQSVESEPVLVSNKYGYLKRSEPSSLGMKTFTKQASSGEVHEKVGYSQRGLSESAFLKKPKKKKGTDDNVLYSVSQGIGHAGQNQVESWSGSTEQRNVPGSGQKHRGRNSASHLETNNVAIHIKSKNNNTSLFNDSKSPLLLRSEDAEQLNIRKKKRKKRRYEMDLDVNTDLNSEDAVHVSQLSFKGSLSTPSEAISENERIKRDNVDSGQKVRSIKPMQYVHSSSITTGVKRENATLCARKHSGDKQQDKKDSIQSSEVGLSMNRKEKKKRSWITFSDVLYTL
ncbi:phoenix [Hoplias malabaricus]|uniref:phoenix n=1 Tax=Hoplias malabaricus TaxID=27720 RepID=UPI00346276FA